LCYIRESSCKTESSEKVKDFVKLNRAGIPPVITFYALQPPRVDGNTEIILSLYCALAECMHFEIV
jgi:hypothetical protein